MSKDKQGDIIIAALKLFAERGYDGTTIPMIAKQAAVGAGTIYHYYENKEALVNSLFVHCVTELTEVLISQFPHTKTLKEQFIYIYQHLFNYAKENINAFLFINSHESGHYLDEHSRLSFQRFLSFFNESLEKGKRDGYIRALDTSVLISIVYSPILMLIKFINKGLLTYSDELLENLIESAWDAIRII